MSDDLLKEEKFTFLYMKQVPKNTAEDFVKLATEGGFGGHFGFCLKALMDNLIIQNKLLSEARLDDLDNELELVKNRLVLLEKLIIQGDSKGDVKEIKQIKRTLGGRGEDEKGV